ncbi:hypothetical protein METBIDRAFT_117839 [Metschnikowia bicuspidata var. bicuspidata NRRL YB-4993]|uniref:Uncharacterized protein n=1 Tax=Metschnikowia bicuspidata var. bicuspidata NRRL YB-4993 TaxID=869754 RepID=A0A1A0HIX1_9ASCO|nr:hypothetical protein METBIDRAFT_117839 [Metschnikowia bicuspidata var. bicuspidata NRRL YB-4993]OBA24104.1 hypothetical protein METBIDRAFT_117839 [Metschnikowia bicuspidata var. bicuspidata NRRL YB-4993]
MLSIPWSTTVHANTPWSRASVPLALFRVDSKLFFVRHPQSDGQVENRNKMIETCIWLTPVCERAQIPSHERVCSKRSTFYVSHQQSSTEVDFGYVSVRSHSVSFPPATSRLIRQAVDITEILNRLLDTELAAH